MSIYSKLYDKLSMPNDLANKMEQVWADQSNKIVCEWVNKYECDEELYKWLISNGADENEYVYIIIHDL